MAKTAIQEMIMALIGLLVFSTSGVSAQTASLGPGQIGCTTADSLSDIWFRHTYLTQRRPINATVSITARGRYRVYVNESNVTPALPSDWHHEPVTIDIDVSGYLRNDSNTIAILYHPAHSHDHDIAVRYYGTARDGHPFSHNADGRWLCRPVREGSGDGIDQGYTQSVSTACWTATSAPHTDLEIWPTTPLQPAWVTRTAAVTTPRYSERTTGGVAYEFVTGFYGFVRITLRGAKKGETITIGGRNYICKGETDEQITTAFTPAYHRRVVVSGDKDFDAAQVQRLEGISLQVQRVDGQDMMTAATYNTYPY